MIQEADLYQWGGGKWAKLLLNFQLGLDIDEYQQDVRGQEQSKAEYALPTPSHMIDWFSSTKGLIP